MITLLARLFIKDRDKVADAAVRRAYGMLCSLTGIGLNVNMETDDLPPELREVATSALIGRAAVRLHRHDGGRLQQPF